MADALIQVSGVGALAGPLFTAATAVSGSGSAAFAGFQATGSGSGAITRDALLRVGAGTLAGPAFTAATGGTGGVYVGAGNAGILLLAQQRLAR